MSMEIELRQAQVIEQLVKKASTLNASSSLAALIVEATSHASLFAFSEILSLPNLLQLQGTENSSYIDLLRLFAYGTWRDYKSNAGTLPKLIPDQVLKFKQLTVLTLAGTNKLLSYDALLEELELANVRELEDFLINDCMYTGIVKGKLDQLRRCFQVQYAAGRDLMHGQLGSMIETLTKWLATSNNLLPLIEEKIDWASTMCQMEMNHQKEVQDKIEEAKKSLSFKKPQHIHKSGYNLWSHNDFFYDFDGEVYHGEDNIQSKRRRSPHNFRQRTPHF